MKIFLISKTSKKKKKQYYELAAVSDDGKWSSVTGPSGNKVLGFPNAKSGNVQLFEGSPNGVSNALSFTQAIDGLTTISNDKTK